jgi:streptogramin lyase
VALGPEGAAYVTDSASPAIYKVSAEGEPSLFASIEKFREENGEGLSSIVFHDDGFLLVSMHEKGQLWKVALTAGEEPQMVKLPRPLPGASGLAVVDKTALVLVQNAGRNVVHRLVSKDGWKTAVIRKTSGRVRHHPTETVVAGGRIYVLESQLDALFDNKPAPGDTKFTIKHLGYLK